MWFWTGGGWKLPLSNGTDSKVYDSQTIATQITGSSAGTNPCYPDHFEWSTYGRDYFRSNILYAFYQFLFFDILFFLQFASDIIMKCTNRTRVLTRPACWLCFHPVYPQMCYLIHILICCVLCHCSTNARPKSCGGFPCLLLTRLILCWCYIICKIYMHIFSNMWKCILFKQMFVPGRFDQIL